MTILFAWRYFKGKKTTNAVNLIAWISILAIAIGAAALILVLSVFNGFEDLVKSLYADFYTDIRVTPAKNKFLTPFYLKKLGLVYEAQNDFKSADEAYKKIKAEYPESPQSQSIDEYIARAEAKF